MFDDEDFDDELSPEEREELEKEERERQQRIRNSPVFRKAREAFDITVALCESLPETDIYEHYKSTLVESAAMLAPKIAGAMGSQSWLLAMQNAAIVRYHAQYLLTSTYGLEVFGEGSMDHINVLRNEMLEFRNLFGEWVDEINRLEEDTQDDEWGLFIKK